MTRNNPHAQTRYASNDTRDSSHVITVFIQISGHEFNTLFTLRMLRSELNTTFARFSNNTV